MKHLKKVLLAGCIGTVLLVLYLLSPIDKPQDMVYAHRIKQELIALANDKVDTALRVADIKKHIKDSWVDGRVGVTMDGYIFYYDIHESHGMDYIDDVHILYLPDEKRFLVTHALHFCCDLSKFEQASSKAAVTAMFKKGYKHY